MQTRTTSFLASSSDGVASVTSSVADVGGVTSSTGNACGTEPSSGGQPDSEATTSRKRSSAETRGSDEVNQGPPEARPLYPFVIPCFMIPGFRDGSGRLRPSWGER